VETRAPSDRAPKSRPAILRDPLSPPRWSTRWHWAEEPLAPSDHQEDAQFHLSDDFRRYGKGPTTFRHLFCRDYIRGPADDVQPRNLSREGHGPALAGQACRRLPTRCWRYGGSDLPSRHDPCLVRGRGMKAARHQRARRLNRAGLYALIRGRHTMGSRAIRGRWRCARRGRAAFGYRVVSDVVMPEMAPRCSTSCRKSNPLIQASSSISGKPYSLVERRLREAYSPAAIPAQYNFPGQSPVTSRQLVSAVNGSE